MMSSNGSLLRKADLAIADLATNGGELNPEQGAAFIRMLIKQPTLIRVCRVVEMVATTARSTRSASARASCAPPPPASP